MATGFPEDITNAWLNGLCNSTTWSEPAAFWVQLHIHDAGNGSSGAAANTTRKQATFAAASGGAITTSADLVWAAVPATEVYRYVSYWTANAAGTCIGVSQLAAEYSITAGQTFTIAAGNLDITLTPLAA